MDNVTEDNIEIEDGFNPGDRVQLAGNYMLTGFVVGERNWGMEYQVRLDSTITPVWFHWFEIEPEMTKGKVH